MIYGGIFLFGFHPEASVLAVGALPLLAAFLFFCAVRRALLRELRALARLVPARDALLRGQLGLQHLAGQEGQRREVQEAHEGRGHLPRAAREDAARSDGRGDGDHARRWRTASCTSRAGRCSRRCRRRSPTSTHYDWMEGEVLGGMVLGWNFGDGHLNHTQLLEAVQAQCGFEPGEVRVVMVESQPLFGRDHAVEDRRRGERRGRARARRCSRDARPPALADGPLRRGLPRGGRPRAPRAHGMAEPTPRPS